MRLPTFSSIENKNSLNVICPFRVIKNCFKKARELRPCIMLIEDIGDLLSDDDFRRVKTEILVQMQGVGQENEGLHVILTTNEPWMISSSIRRRYRNCGTRENEWRLSVTFLKTCHTEWINKDLYLNCWNLLYLFQISRYLIYKICSRHDI